MKSAVSPRLTTHTPTINLFFFNDTATPEIYTLSLHDALPIFADPVHGLRVDLALDLGDVDQLCGAAGAGDEGLTGPEFSVWPVALDQGRCRFGQSGDDIGSQDALDQWADHHEQHHEAEQHHDAELDDVHDVILGELQHAEQAARLHNRGDSRRFGKAKVDHPDLVAALLVEAD